MPQARVQESHAEVVPCTSRGDKTWGPPVCRLPGREPGFVPSCLVGSRSWACPSSRCELWALISPGQQLLLCVVGSQHDNQALVSQGNVSPVLRVTSCSPGLFRAGEWWYYNVEQ